MVFFKGKKGKVDDVFFDNSSIKVIAMGCIIIIVALIFMSYMSIFIIKNAVISKLKTNDMVNLAESVGAEIEGKIDKAVDASLMMAHDPVIMGWAEGRESDEQATSIVEARMGDLVHSFGYDTSFLVNNVTRHYWSYYGDAFKMIDIMSEVDNEDQWFFDTIIMGKEYEINIDYNDKLNDTFVWINALMGDVANPVAVIGLGMNLSDVIDELILEEDKNKIKNDIWLVNGEGIIYLSKNQDYINKNIEDAFPSHLAEEIKAYKDYNKQFAVDDYVNDKGNVYDIAYKRIKDTEWKLIVQIPRSETTGFLSTVALNMIISCIIIIALMVILFYFVSNRIANPYKRAIEMNKELEKVVEERTSELQEKNIKIQDSIEYAWTIQQTILPSNAELRKNLKEYFIIFEPRDIIGGDFYWMKRCSKGLLLVVGDCTGHGVVGALMTTAVNAMLNQITEEFFDDPAEILKELDRRIKEFGRQKDTGEIVSYGLDAAVVYISDSKHISYEGANFSFFISDGEKVEEVAGHGGTIDCMIGGKSKNFENHIFEYNQKSTFYLITDGFREQPGGEKMIPFGRTKLLELISTVKELPMEEQKEYMKRSLREYQGNGTRRDDVTVLGFKL